MAVRLTDGLQALTQRLLSQSSMTADFDRFTSQLRAVLERMALRIPVVTPWVPYAPLFTTISGAGAIGNGSIFGQWRRVGDSVEVQVQAQFGSTSAFGAGSSFRFSLPPRMLRKSTAPYFSVPSGVFLDDASAADARAGVALVGPGTSYIMIAATGTTGAPINSASPWAWASGDTIWCSATVEIEGF